MISRHVTSRITLTPLRSQAAFSLLEVMIACGIFFMAIFAILALVSEHPAQRPQPPPR